VGSEVEGFETLGIGSDGTVTVGAGAGGGETDGAGIGTVTGGGLTEGTETVGVEPADAWPRSGPIASEATTPAAAAVRTARRRARPQPSHSGPDRSAICLLAHRSSSIAVNRYPHQMNQNKVIAAALVGISEVLQ
jgi:hypothetical protein